MTYDAKGNECCAARQTDGCYCCRVCGLHWDEDETVICRHDEMRQRHLERLRNALERNER